MSAAAGPPPSGRLVFFLSGGLGFANLLNDAHPSGAGPLAWLSGLVGAVLPPVREYTLDRDIGFQWLNPVLAYLVPQRTTLFGFSLGLLALSLLWYGRSRSARREALLAGVVLGMMPLLHAATYFDLMLLTAGLSAIDLGVAVFGKASWEGALKRWLAFFVPALVVGLPQLWSDTAPGRLWTLVPPHPAGLAFQRCDRLLSPPDRSLLAAQHRTAHPAGAGRVLQPSVGQARSAALPPPVVAALPDSQPGHPATLGLGQHQVVHLVGDPGLDAGRAGAPPADSARPGARGDRPGHACNHHLLRLP